MAEQKIISIQLPVPGQNTMVDNTNRVIDLNKGWKIVECSTFYLTNPAFGGSVYVATFVLEKVDKPVNW